MQATDDLVRVPVRENVETRGRRYLVEGRLTLMTLNMHRGIITARCVGRGQTHHLGYNASGYWCDCEARSRCAHLVALELVTEKPSRW